MEERDRLEKEIEQLKKKLNRCFEKLMLTDDPEKEIDLEALEEKLEAEIKQKERKLNQLSVSQSSNNRNALDLEESLWNIDFDVPKQLVRQASQSLTQNQGGSVLFLIERCVEMEGYLLLKSIRNILESNTQQFLEYPIEFVPTMPANKAAFLKILGGHLGLVLDEVISDDSGQKLVSFSAEIVSAISGLLRSGTTVFIPLSNWQSLGADDQVHFLDWFMNTFWKNLVNAVSKAMVDYFSKVFFVIMVDNNLAEDCRKDEYFCDIQCLDSCKLLSLPMAPWCHSDISLWLGNYSSKLTKSERDQLVNYIFGSSSEEIPLKIRVALERAHAQSLF